VDRKTESRLKRDIVVWFCTVGADSRPHATLVWFLWDGESFVVHSVPGQKTRDIERNPNVLLHLNSDPEGAEMVRVSGTAKIVSRDKPAAIEAAYRRKYQRSLKDLGYTWDQFAGEYHLTIRINPVRFH
jgi:PPOX class probable F420-dependent enzyme